MLISRYFVNEEYLQQARIIKKTRSITEHRWDSLTIDPRVSIIMDVGLMFFNDHFYYQLLVYYTEAWYNISKFEFVWLLALVFDRTLAKKRYACSQKIMKNDIILKSTCFFLEIPWI